MSEFKPGDRVKVEFEAEVVAPRYRGTALEVRTVGNGCFEFYDLENLKFTLIEQPIILPEIPGTIVQVDPLNEHGAREVFEFMDDERRKWYPKGYPWISTYGLKSTEELKFQCREYDYRLIRVATEEFTE